MYLLQRNNCELKVKILGLRAFVLFIEITIAAISDLINVICSYKTKMVKPIYHINLYVK